MSSNNKIHIKSNQENQTSDMKSCTVESSSFQLEHSLVWIHAYQNTLFTQAFWQAFVWPWIILCSPLPPGHHNHTSNLIKPQLCPCQSAPALRSFPPLAFLWFNYILSYPPPPALTPYSLFFSIFILLCFPLPWHQGQPWPVQAPGLKQISLGLYSSTRIKNS